MDFELDLALLWAVDPISASLIDFVEAAYDLDIDQQQWLPRLLDAGAPVIDHGLGVFALTCMRPPQRAPLIIDQLNMFSCPDDFEERLIRLQKEMPPDLLWPLSRPGMPKTLSEVARNDVEAFRLIMRHFDFAKDGLGISTFDPNGRGVFLIAALPAVTTLNERSRERWQMLAAHFGAGYRLRRALPEVETKPATDLPHGAEAVIDPTTFRVTDAHGQAKSSGALDALREAAIRVDRARGRMRETDPEKALELWKALVRGRCVSDPRGLTEREMQVVAYVLSAQTNKLIGYHLGLSKGRVSTLLSSAMRKLGVQTRGQLIKRLRDFGPITED
jgi:DNA-binding CsgD family transcriptional regulator